MAETILKSKAQLRSISVTSNGSNGSSPSNGDKTPTTPSKLMLNHGKPNFTIQRSPRAQENGAENPLTQELQANKNNNYNPYKKAESQSYKSNNSNLLISTKFNGAFRPANVPLTQKQPHQNGNDENDNEAAKVVLRRPKAAAPLAQENGNAADNDDDGVPEFIKRQRRIQERLAKENILDFENRRSGYFTHVVITPTSPNRQSLVETMTSPAVVPALEIPPPTPTSPPPQAAVPTMLEVHEESVEPSEQHTAAATTNGYETNGHHTAAAAEAEAVEEEEVAKAIEEVNKAVAGEDDEKPSEPATQVVQTVEAEQHVESTAVESQSSSQAFEPVVPVASTWHPIEPPAEFQNQLKTHVEESVDMPAVVAAVTSLEITEPAVEPAAPATAAAPTTALNGHIEVVEVHAEPKANGHHDDDVTISHTNGFDGPSIPAPDPSGALGVNYEPKTVVSFAKDLSSEPNKYPDTVKVVNEHGEAKTPIDEQLQDIAKLKFDIKTDEQQQDVQVTPVLRVD